MQFDEALIMLRGKCKVTRKIWGSNYDYIMLVGNDIQYFENGLFKMNWLPHQPDILANDWHSVV